MLRPVVVGLDGSRQSPAAAEWAAREALRRGMPLCLAHAWAEHAPADVLGPWRERFPNVQVPALVENGLLARLGTHTGPVAHAAMHHVRCPAAIVPHE